MRLIIAVIMMLAFVSVASASTVQLQWDANTEPDLASYKVYQQIGAASMPFTQVQSVPKGTQAATISGLDSTKAYSFAVTAVNSSGQESAYSNIVSVPIFPKAPANLRSITVVISP